MEKTLRLLLLTGLLLLIFILPTLYVAFFNHPFDFVPYSSLMFFGATLLLINCFYFLVTKKRVMLGDKHSLFAVGGFLGIYVVSTVFSISPLTSLFGLYGFYNGGLISFLSLLVVLYTVLIMRDEKKPILQSIALSGLAVSLFGIYEYVLHLLTTKEVVFRVSSLLGQPNRLAFFLLAILPISFAVWIDEKKLSSRMIFGISFFANLLAFFLTFSRAAYLVLFMTTLLFFFALKSKKVLYLKLKKLVFVFILCFVVFGIFFLRTIPFVIRNFSQSSLGLRITELQGATEAIRDRSPARQLIGSGPETVYFTFFKYKPTSYAGSSEEKNSGPAAARNTYVNILSSVGLLGLALYLLFLWKVLSSSFFQRKKDILNMGAFLSLLTISIFSLFYFQTFGVAVIFWIIAGLSLKGKIVKVQEARILQVVAVCGILSTFVLYYLCGVIVIAEYYSSVNPTKESLIQAMHLNPWTDAYQRQLSKFYGDKMITIGGSNKLQATKQYKLALQAGEKSIALSPYDVRNIRQLSLISYWAGVHINKKYHRDSFIFAKKYVELAPTESEAYEALGLVYLDTGDLDKADETFNKQKELVPRNPIVYLHLGEIAKQKGKLPLAIEYYKKALMLVPNLELGKIELQKAQKLFEKGVKKRSL